MKRRLFSLLGVSVLVGMFSTILFTAPVFAAGTSTPTALCGQWQGWTPAEMVIPDSSDTPHRLKPSGFCHPYVRGCQRHGA